MTVDGAQVPTLDGKDFLGLVLKYRQELDCLRTNDVRGYWMLSSLDLV